MKTKEILLKNAPGLEGKVSSWRFDLTYINGARQITEAILANNINHSVYQSAKYPEFALMAYLNDQISLAQFCTTTFHWNALQDFGSEVESIQHHTLTKVDSLAAEALRPYCQLMTNNGFMRSTDNINVPLPQAEFKQLIVSLLDDEVPDSERSFIVLHLKDSAKMPDLFHAFEQLGFTLFMPIVQNGHYEVLVPSFSMLENLLRTMSTNELKLCPTIGDTSAQTVLDFHEDKSHPLGLSFPGFEHTKADGFDSKMLLFVLHDIYHVVLLLFVKMLNVINASAQVGQRYLEEHQIPEQSILHQRVGFLIDAEMRQYYQLAVIEKFGLTQYVEDLPVALTPELNFAFLLSRVLLPKIPDLEDSNLDDAEHQVGLMVKIIADMVQNRQSYQENGIDITNCLLSFLNIDQVINEIKKFLPLNAAGDENLVVMSELIDCVTKFQQLCAEILLTEKHYAIFDQPTIEWLKQIPIQKKRLFDAVQNNELVSVQGALADIKKHAYLVNINCQDDQLNTPLALAVRHQNIPIVECLLEHGANVNQVVSKSKIKMLSEQEELLLGTRVLHLAAQKSQPDLLLQLIKKGASLTVYDAKKRSPIDIAIERGLADNFNLLLKHCELSDTHIDYLFEKDVVDDRLKNVLVAIKEQRHECLDIVKYRGLEELKQFQGKNPGFNFGGTLYEKDYQEIKHRFLLVPKECAKTNVFELAIECYSSEILEYLLAVAQNDQKRNRQLLIDLSSQVVRAQEWTPALIKKYSAVLNQNVDVNVFVPLQEGLFATAKTMTIWTFLRDIPYSKGFFALTPSNHLSMSKAARKLFIENGADPNQPNKKGTPELIYAVITNDMDYLTFLLDHGAHVNIFDRSIAKLGTALHVASGIGNAAMVKLLCARGADRNVTNQVGQTPYQLAVMNGFAEELSQYFPDENKRLIQECATVVEPLMPSHVGSVLYIREASSKTDYQHHMMRMRTDPLVHIIYHQLIQQLSLERIDYDHSVFSHQKFWDAVLIAWQQGDINTEQLASMALRQATQDAYRQSVLSTHHYKLDGKNEYAENTLRRFLQLPKKYANKITEALKNQESDTIEKTFSVLVLKDNSYAKEYMSGLYKRSAIPFKPLQDGKTLMVIIPTFTMMKTVIEQCFPKQTVLKAVFEKLDDVQTTQYLQNDIMPFEICLDGKHRLVDMTSSFVRALMFSANPKRQLLLKVTTLYQEVLAQHPKLHRLNFIQQLTHEQAQPLLHYELALREEKADLPASLDAALFHQALVDAFSVQDTFDNVTLEQELREYEDKDNPKSTSVLNEEIERIQQDLSELRMAKRALLHYFFKDMIEHHEAWLTEYGFSVAHLLDQFNLFELPVYPEMVRSSYQNYTEHTKGNIFDFSFESMLISSHLNEIVQANIRGSKECKATLLDFLECGVLQPKRIAWAKDMLKLREKLQVVIDTDVETEALLRCINVYHEQYQFDFNVPLLDGRSILLVACEHQDLPAVQRLLELGCSPKKLPDLIRFDQKKDEGQLATCAVHIAAKANNPHLLEMLLDFGADLEVYNQDKLSPLGISLVCGYPEIVRICLQRLEISQEYIDYLRRHHSIHESVETEIQRYFDYRDRLYTFIHDDNTDESTLKALLANYPEYSLNCLLKDSHGFESVDVDAYQHRPKGAKLIPAFFVAQSKSMMRLLQRYGIDINVKNRFNQTRLMESINLCQQNFSFNFIGTQFFLNMHKSFALALIDLGADVTVKNQKNQSALSLAIECEQIDLVKAILSKYSEANNILEGIFPLVNIVNSKKGWTKNSVDICRVLLEHGLDFTYRSVVNRGLFDSMFSQNSSQSLWQILRSIAQRHYDEDYKMIEDQPIDLPIALRYLAIKNGADINEPLQSGQSEIFYAIENDYDDYLCELIKLGADLNVCNNAHQTALEYAKQLGRTRCIEVIQEHDAKPQFGFFTSVKGWQHAGNQTKEFIAFHEHDMRVKIMEKEISDLLDGKNKSFFQMFGVWGQWDSFRNQKLLGAPFLDTATLNQLSMTLTNALRLGTVKLPRDAYKLIDDFISLVNHYNTLVSESSYLMYHKRLSKPSEQQSDKTQYLYKILSEIK